MTRRHLPILSDAERIGMNPSLLEPIEYRKSGLSLNHIVGCPRVLSVSSGHEYVLGLHSCCSRPIAGAVTSAPQVSWTESLSV